MEHRARTALQTHPCQHCQLTLLTPPCPRCGVTGDRTKQHILDGPDDGLNGWLKSESARHRRMHAELVLFRGLLVDDEGQFVPRRIGCDCGECQ